MTHFIKQYENSANIIAFIYRYIIYSIYLTGIVVVVVLKKSLLSLKFI